MAYETLTFRPSKENKTLQNCMVKKSLKNCNLYQNTTYNKYKQSKK